MNVATECPKISELDDLLDEKLSSERQRVLQEHLEVCAKCQERVENLDVDAALASHLRAPRAQVDTKLEAVIEEIKSNSTVGEACESESYEVSLDFLDPSDNPEFIGRLGRYEISEQVGRGGIVRDPSLHRQVLGKISACIQGHGWGVQAFCPSPLLGADGNREFLVHFKPRSPGLEGEDLSACLQAVLAREIGEGGT